MDRCNAVFQPRNVQQSLLQIDLIPAQADKLRDAQAMTIGDQNEGGIARAMAAEARRRCHQRCHLIVRQVFPGAIGGVGPADENFPVFDGWRGAIREPGTRGFAHCDTPVFP
jgi:hypothetical protein